MESVGERIKKTRLSQGLSQVELAIAADVSQPTVANWENDSHAPRQRALNRLAGILKTSSHWLLSGNEDQNGNTLTSKQYLETSIQHVPILGWPIFDDMFDRGIRSGPVHDYLAISTVASSPFALIASDPAMASHFPIGSAIIFDAKQTELEEGGCYLFAKNGKIILRRWQSMPDRLEALPNQSAVDADFVSERPQAMAKALLSVRRH